jgi:hypothetical protein
MESGKVLFFTDFDVGDGIYDNFTALEASLNLIYQYSDNDDYAGLAFLYPDTIPFQFGNFQDWFFEGTDAKIDSILMNSFQADTSLYDTTFEVMTGDYSSYIVLDIGDVPAGQQKTVTFAFAIQENLDALNFQIETARDYYINQLLPLSIANPSPPRNLHSSLSLYPNPFNSQAVINFNLNSSGFGKIQVYNQSGQLVKSLFNGYLPQGFHQVKWENGGKSGSGIYFLRAEFPGTSAVKKVILIK